MPNNIIDLTGKIFGKLTVIEMVPMPSYLKSKGRAHWRCLCSCGNETIVCGSLLSKGSTKSCGCYRIEKVSTTGGLCIKYPKEYKIWCNIKTRTTNKNRDSFRYYGGRGIKMCNRWKKSFASFLNDMGPRPVGELHTIHIDRIDNNGGYTPENCRWTTAKENSLNSSVPKFLIDPFDGEVLCIADMSRKYNININTFYHRIRNKKLTLIDAITKTARTKILNKNCTGCL